jgi:hypothetical protein
MFDKAIHGKLDQMIDRLGELLAGQETQARMTADLIQMLDGKRFDSEQRKKALEDYMRGITGMMQGSGAPPELIENFKTLFSRSFQP